MTRSIATPSPSTARGSRDDKAGITARGYVQQFVRGFAPLQVLAPSPLLPGGLSFKATSRAIAPAARSTATSSSSQQLRVLYGAEAFHEWKPDTHDVAPGRRHAVRASPAPYDLTRLPLLCPRDLRRRRRWRLVPVRGLPADVRVRRRPHRARRVRQSAVPAEQEADLRRSAPASRSRPTRSARSATRSTPTVAGTRRVELHPELALEAQLRAGLPAAGVQQHDVERRRRADRR